MKTRWKILLITLLVGVPAFVLGPVIWTPSPEIHPTQTEMPYLMVLSAIEALVFGFGVAFIIYGRRLLRPIAEGSGKVPVAMYISLAWILISWWPHDNLHIHNALDIGGLIGIEYAFHFTVILAALVLTYSFYSLFKPASARDEAREECPVDQPNCHLSPVRP
jgi:hypothetical protein